jgi:hypothetical protein
MSKFSRFTRSAKLRTSICALCSICFLVSESAIAQNTVYQRTFPVSVSEANAAIQKTSVFLKGRLPTVEGFALQTDQPIARYDKGYYECTFQVSPGPGGGTVVRATAKVTAWYSDPDATRSGYRVLVSNGRLESDALDRIAEVLTSPASAGSNGKTQSPAPPASSAEGAKRGGLILPGRTTNYGTRTGSSLSLPAEPASSRPSTSGDSAESVSTADEKRIQELSTYIQNLEEIQRNQSHPNDLAAVKKTNTPVFAQPSENARVLMDADAQDEFQVLGADGTWVHVQISGMSRGWIRLNQLEMPLGLSQTESASPGNSSAPETSFKISREETTSFRGNWQPLKGKPVRIEWVEPINSAISTSRKEKLTFAKSVFVRAFKNLGQSQQSAEGIVVVFDSADGGQIAAPASSVKALADRTLSDAAFWRECSFEPPESFLESVKK